MAEKEGPERVEPESLVELIGSEGKIARFLKGYEARPQQQQMLRDIAEAYNHKKIALIEAGTGTGKSLAYLIPALIWAAKHKKRTVIATGTITLQEQLVNKDIPMLMKALGLDLQVALVKGMGNYLCQRKLDETLPQVDLRPDEEQQQLVQLSQWVETTKDGSRADLPINPLYNVWELVGAEADTCNFRRCSHHSQCFFFGARKQAEDAQILVVNHHLLFADLVRRAHDDNYDKPAVLPEYDHLIIDEAHNIEDVAAEYFATRLSRAEASRLVARMSSEKTGKLTDLKRKLTEYFSRSKNAHPPLVAALRDRLTFDLPGLRREYVQQFGEFFDMLTAFAEHYQAPADESGNLVREIKLRLRSQHLNSPTWGEEVVPLADKLIRSLATYSSGVAALLAEVKDLPDKFQEQTQGICHDVNALNNRLVDLRHKLKKLVSVKEEENSVRWMEVHYSKARMPNSKVIGAHLDIASKLRDHLFNQFQSIVLCSATLATGGDFAFYKQRLGLDDQKELKKPLHEACFDSPFNYDKQALLAIPTDVPLPNCKEFLAEAIERIWEAICASRGNALVLFTSFGMLKKCYEALQQRLQERRFPLFKQGDGARHKILEQFRNTDYSVLFATYSFWEGVDLAGDTLRCVVITKLPFKVPTEPLTQARSEAIVAAGRDAFWDYSLPMAVVKFKQGFGRLIRNASDRGCIVCLDSRTVNKGYGQLFIKSLPPSQKVFAPATEIMTAMQDFYKNTHHFAKK